MPPEDEELLLRFKQARERESQLKDKVGPQLRRDEIRRLVSALCCIFTVIVALLVSSLNQFPSLSSHVYLSLIFRSSPFTYLT